MGKSFPRVLSDEPELEIAQGILNGSVRLILNQNHL
jgi:hypothetical protein